MHLIDGAGRWTAPPGGAGNDWVEQLRVPDLSVGTYCIPAGGVDDQSPHTEDEIYVVTSGRARIVTPDASADVAPGSVVFVPAGEPHHFTDVTEDLTLLVVFGPAYGSRTG
ncbi:cupin domain-containing protein [Dactylosporangium aurantiacum]|uniref:Cupin domain-containing protein n=1 Tax=Dactylosporangium aurantiacum TaxID=35754 RepID=A0A9Q9MFC5_9ACTN|nr:cupin domain-containing protein [Dactylosporangium aurantiacum]MDG6106464.1 cupin domain-containing protein [Dactylosporangium aurantiacum]UWZ50501.1 cupin domain-containing protein [Dactylosporangium aurantiacum]